MSTVEKKVIGMGTPAAGTPVKIEYVVDPTTGTLRQEVVTASSSAEENVPSDPSVSFPVLLERVSDLEQRVYQLEARVALARLKKMELE